MGESIALLKPGIYWHRILKWEFFFNSLKVDFWLLRMPDLLEKEMIFLEPSKADIRFGEDQAIYMMGLQTRRKKLQCKEMFWHIGRGKLMWI